MQGLISVSILALIHLYANKTKVLGWVWHGRFLSFAAGISFAYVFVDLLPTLEKGQPLLKAAFPYLDKHVYLIALLGLLFFYGLQRKTEAMKKEKFWLSISGSFLFNFFVGATLSDTTNPEIQPLAFFTIAIAMHYFVRDHKAREESKPLFMQKGRWWLVVSLFGGYLVGYWTQIPNTVIAIAVSLQQEK
jgi:hypothetical protein